MRTPGPRTKLAPDPGARTEVEQHDLRRVDPQRQCVREAITCGPRRVPSEEVLHDVLVEPRPAVDALVVVEMVDLLVLMLRCARRSTRRRSAAARPDA